MRVAAHIMDGLAPLIDLIYPPRCPLCGEGIAAQDGLCAPCWNGLLIPGEPCCSSCQRPIAADSIGEGAICVPCMADPPKHDGIAAATIYNDRSRKLVLALKHGGRIALAPMLSRLMAAKVPKQVEPFLVIPVPLHRWRLWRRGYNQSALLGREVAKLVSGDFAVDALVRCKHTPTLGGMGKVARKKALSRAIAIRPSRSDQIRGRAILLVDDVLTSGATSDACVDALKKGGAKSVTIACFARVLDDADLPTRTCPNETPGAEAPGVA